jgi:hypothetical protein
LDEAYGGHLQLTKGWLEGVNAWLKEPILTKILDDKIKTLKLGIFVEGDGTVNFLKLID